VYDLPWHGSGSTRLGALVALVWTLRRCNCHFLLNINININSRRCSRGRIRAEADSVGTRGTVRASGASGGSKGGRTRAGRLTPVSSDDCQTRWNHIPMEGIVFDIVS